MLYFEELVNIVLDILLFVVSYLFLQYDLRCCIYSGSDVFLILRLKIITEVKTLWNRANIFILTAVQVVFPTTLQYNVYSN